MSLSQLLKPYSHELQSELQLILNAVVEGLCGVDGQGNLTFCNEAILRMTGYGTDELIGNNFHSLLHHSQPDGARYPEGECALLKAMVARQEIHITHEFLWRKDRSCFPVEYWAHPLPQPSSRTTCVITIQDITESERAIEALRSSEERFRLISSNIDQAFYLVDVLASRLVYASSAFETITGRNCQESRNKPSPWRDLAVPEHQERVRAGYERLVAGEEAREEYQIRHSDGSTRWIKDHAKPIRDANGRVSMFAGVVEDITEIHEARDFLHRSEERLRRILASIPDVAWTSDQHGHTIYISPKIEDLLGYTAEEVCGGGSNLWLGQIHPEDFGRVVQAYGLLFDKQASFDQEYRIRRKDGVWIWVHDRATGIHQEDGLLYADGLLTDVTERKREMEELHSSRQTLQSILDAIPQRVFWKDRNCVYVGCNRPFAMDAGVDHPAAIVGKNDFDLSWRGLAEVYRADDKLVMQRRTAKLDFQELLDRPDGSVMWIQTNKLPLFDLEGKVVGVLGTYEDITQRKRVEKELRLTQFSLEHASDGVQWIDSEARIVYVNQAECRNLECSRDEILSLTIPDIDPLFSKETWKTFWHDLKTRGAMTFETQTKTRRGRIFPAEVSANYLEFDGQEYCFAFVRDITERRALETQLRQAQKLEGIGQLAAGIAHEINTPTQFVTDNLTFLRDAWRTTHELLELYRSALAQASEALPPGVLDGLKQAEQMRDFDFIVTEAPRAIDQSLDGARRVAEIVRAMKAFSHPDSADKSATNLNQSVESTITVARNEWKYVAEVFTELDASLPSVMCYPGDINQVILNLVVNAAQAIKEKVKEGEKGRITVCTRTRGEFAEISVADTGTGIPESIRPRIFEPFFTTKEVGKGTGQGLALAHSVVVKKHHGTIWFETEMERGTTFFVDLPIKQSDPTNET